MKNLSAEQIPNPATIDESPRGERQMDVYTRLLKERIIYLGTSVSSTSANMIVAQMLFLEANNPEKPIQLYINSPGGSVHDGLAIYDVMQQVKCPVHTIAAGMAASMGSFLLMAGEQGHRYAMPNSMIMIHQPRIHGGGLDGTVTDIDIQALNLKNTKEKLTRTYALHSGQDYQKLYDMMERDKYMSSTEAKELGLIDHVIESSKVQQLKKLRGL